MTAPQGRLQTRLFCDRGGENFVADAANSITDLLPDAEQFFDLGAALMGAVTFTGSIESEAHMTRRYSRDRKSMLPTLISYIADGSLGYVDDPEFGSYVRAHIEKCELAFLCAGRSNDSSKIAWRVIACRYGETEFWRLRSGAPILTLPSLRWRSRAADRSATRCSFQ
jgi:hypothetical protein